MAGFWDDRARENAPFFVDNRVDYASPDLAAFWAAGDEAVRYFEERLGLAIAPGDEVVEIGCGIGRVTRVLAQRAKTVQALDVSAEMLARAREHHATLANVEWLLGDGLTITGVADASADGVFSHVVFQHLPDPAVTYGYIAEMGRVLRPGGWAAFQVSDDPAVHRRRNDVRARVSAAMGRAPKGSTHPAWLGSAVNLDILRTTAGQAGLAVERVTGERTQYCLVLLRK
jgi:SAM-dependent methyltransferase